MSSGGHQAGAFRELAVRVAERLAAIPGISAIVLGGSCARGTADEHSDVDLGLYYDPRRPFETAVLDQSAALLDDRRCTGLVTGFGDWGPGVNGGGWLIIDGRHVDLLYRDQDKVKGAIDACRAGRPESIYQLGHPLGFHNQIYAGEVFCCRAIYDPEGLIGKFKRDTAQYPESLRQRLIAKHLFDAAFELQISGKPAQRGDVLLVAACASRIVGFLLLVLYALNRRYFVNEKGALAESRGFDLKPEEFHVDAAAALARIGEGPTELSATLGRLANLVETVRNLSERRD